MCATEPRSIASTLRSICRGEIRRSKNQADEQSAKRSSSVTLNGVLADSSARTRGCFSFVSRVKARRARVSWRSQPFATARASASSGFASDEQREGRSRSRSVGAASSSQVSCESGRRRVQRRTSSGSKSATTSSQKGLGSRGLPSSVAASRTSVSRRVARVQAV